jgi:hypothetical protein
VGATIFTVVLGISICVFFMWTNANGQRHDREFERENYARAAEKQAAWKAQNENNASNLPKSHNIHSHRQSGKQPRTLFEPFLYRADRRPSISSPRISAGAKQRPC